MIVSIHQPNYLPYLGFFDKMRDSDIFIILDNAQYVKNDYHNRNMIKGPNGPIWLTIPIPSDDCFKNSINQVHLPKNDWSSKHWANIEFNYRKAVHFEEHKAFFESLYRDPPELLSDMNIRIIKYIADKLGITAKIMLASEMGIDPDLKGTDMLIALLKKAGADTYISGRGRAGKDHYIEEDKFKEAGIRLVFQEFNHPEYNQQFPKQGFVKYMSAIDFLFNEVGSDEADHSE